MVAEDLSGMKFGRLTVIQKGECYICKNGIKRTRWLCRCECGNTVNVLAYNLKSGNSKSCGCLNDESRISRSTKHGMRHTRLYSIWTNIKSRCYLESSQNYERYGGRGISMCDEWRNSFESFMEWSVNNGYDESLAGRGECTIDRIDVNKNYSPDNCRWVDATTQANNRRNTIFVTAFGSTKSLAEWSRVTGIKYHTLFARIYKLGWSPEAALSK